MKKRLCFALVIGALHLSFAFAAGFGILSNSAHGEGLSTYASPLVKLLLSPIYYPFRNAPHSGFLFAANSLLWGVMAERLVFGRKTVSRKKRGAA